MQTQRTSSIEGIVFVEIKKHNGSTITTAPVKPIIISQSGIGTYTSVPSSVNSFTKDEYIEILVYADKYKQDLITKSFIHPVLFEF